jgi:hypothetical protein
VCLEPEVVAAVSSFEPIDQGIVPWSGYDLLWIQHEYGIFGPEDDKAVIDLVDLSPIPIAVTLHTVPARPSTRQRTYWRDLSLGARGSW